MACHFLNKSLTSLNQKNVSSGVHARSWNECYKSLDEYKSDEELAHVLILQDYPDALLKFSAICTFIFMMISIPGNFITIVALSKYKKVRNATAIFVINLSVSDLLLTCLVFPIRIALTLNKSWTTGRVMCRIFPAVSYALTATSLFSIVAITVNRYVMVLHPVHYLKFYQTRNLVIMIITIWMGGLGVIMPVLFEVWGRFSLDPRVGYCTIIPDRNGKTPNNAIIVMLVILPSFFIIACYTRIIYAVKMSTAKSKSKQPTTPANKRNPEGQYQQAPTREPTSSGSSDEGETTDDKQTKSEGALTKFKKNCKATFARKPKRLSVVPTKRDKRLQSMILAILLSFLGCHLPFLIVKVASKEFAMGPYGKIMGITLIYMAVCCNPIIYAAISKEYREAYKKVFGCM